MDYIVEPFSVRLKIAMENMNLSAIELSRKTNINRSIISQWLKGQYKAKQDKLTILSDVLNVSEVWLMGYDVPMKKTTPKNNILAEYGLLTNDTISVQGLNEDDIKEIKRQIEYLKNKNNNTQK